MNSYGVPDPLASDQSAPLFNSDFYLDIAHQMDPDQDISPDALKFFNDIANDFLTTVLWDTVRLKRQIASNKQIEIGTDDIHYILQTRFGMTLPGGRILNESNKMKPTQEYNEKLEIVREFTANHRDD